MNVLRVDLQGLVTRLTEGYGSHHNQDHAEMVAANAARIYAALKSDNPLLHDTGAEKIVEASAWLHDVLDHKMISNEEEYTRKEKEMKEFLKERFNESQVELIFNIINNVSYSKEVKGLKTHLGEYEVLRDIVSDADKLEAIGELGIIRCYQYNSYSHPNLSDQEVVGEMKQHCEDKLLKLHPQFIRTTPGREMGVELHKSVVDFHAGVTTIQQLLEKHSIYGA